MIETPRLVLRPLGEKDREPFAALNGDARVSDWLGGPIDRAASDALVDRLAAHQAQHGFTFWGAERRADGRLIGMIGLRTVPAGDLPVGPAIEMGWRLSPEAQGQGLVTEGARATLAWGFANIDTPEIIAFTAHSNLKSQAVMTRIGMTADPSRDFDHPRLAEGHPLRRHVVYGAARP